MLLTRRDGDAVLEVLVFAEVDGHQDLRSGVDSTDGSDGVSLVDRVGDNEGGGEGQKCQARELHVAESVWLYSIIHISDLD